MDDFTHFEVEFTNFLPTQLCAGISRKYSPAFLHAVLITKLLNFNVIPRPGDHRLYLDYKPNVYSLRCFPVLHDNSTGFQFWAFFKVDAGNQASSLLNAEETFIYLCQGNIYLILSINNQQLVFRSLVAFFLSRNVEMFDEK